MMYAWHLLWIVPAAVGFGYVMCAVLCAGRR